MGTPKETWADEDAEADARGADDAEGAADPAGFGGAAGSQPTMARREREATGRDLIEAKTSSARGAWGGIPTLRIAGGSIRIGRGNGGSRHGHTHGTGAGKCGSRGVLGLA